MRIRVKDHTLPHFHVVYNGEDASFSIIDCSRMRGTIGLERYYGVIRSWWECNNQMLIEEWNNSRPANCPVGPIRLPLPRSL
jgi:hypothetical protein